jgi:glycosyltransferase involved in cell wall biosynthesis
MAGPAIRAVELAKVLQAALAGRKEVILAAPNQAQAGGLEAVPFGQGRLAELVKKAAVVIGQGLAAPLVPLLSPEHALVLDFYDPNPVELMAFFRDAPRREARRSQEHLRHRLLALARRGDLFLCATPRQRDFWLGLLAAAGRLSWEADQSHPNLDDLLAIVPFGLPAAPPHKTRPALKGVWPGIKPTDKVLLWGGGIWNWFDPLTVIRAIAYISRQRDDVKLFFLGVAHPNPRIPAMAMAGRALDLARELDLLDRVVFLNHGWVEYQDRVNYLLEADLAVLASGLDLETHLSFRTRVLDALWAGTPLILTEGDHFADLARNENLGRVVPVGDDRAMAQAILGLVDDQAAMDRCRANVARLAERLTWARVAEPLVEFCLNPRRHPGAVHSRRGQARLAFNYYFGVARVLARYGGPVDQLRRRLAARRRA